MAKTVQEFKESRDKIYVRAPKESFNKWEIAILMPRTENKTETARQATKDGCPACILMSTELVYYTAQERDRTFNPKIMRAIKSVVKLALMANDTT